MDIPRNRGKDASPKLSEIWNPGELRMIREEPGLKLVAHRGLNELAPEATIPAYTLAGQMDMWGLKIDICETKDGKFICSHDYTVDRMFDGKGSIASLTLSEILQMTVVSGANIDQYPCLKAVRLEEALEICRNTGMHPLINFKRLIERSSVARIVDIIRDSGLIDTTICQCSEDIVEYLYALREVTDKIPILFWLWEMNLIYGLPVIRTLGNACLSLNAIAGMEHRQFEVYADTLRNMGMPVCAAMLTRSQTGLLQSWIPVYRPDLIVTSGITPEDLNVSDEDRRGQV